MSLALDSGPVLAVPFRRALGVDMHLFDARLDLAASRERDQLSSLDKTADFTTVGATREREE